ncbi:MAG: hypothetical protein ACYTFK_11635 [Planctomycetota bacterium]|jgi:ornithine carbamoyltransferase
MELAVAAPAGYELGADTIAKAVAAETVTGTVDQAENRLHFQRALLKKLMA